MFAMVDGLGRTWARERHVMLERLAARAERSSGLEVWTTNLEYDLINLFGIERITELSFKFGKSYLCGAQWRGHKVRFRDTIRHLPISVETLGELIGLPKQHKRLFDKNRRPTEGELRQRCVRDAAITRGGAVKLHELYAEVGGVPKLTLASSAYHLWAKRFWRREVRRPLQEHWQAAFEAYYGGRTEPFSVGTFANVRACDAVSMFPWAMTCAPLPLPWGGFRRQGADASMDPNGFYRVTVRSDLPIPILPYRSEEGLVFPNGRWSGWYVGTELLAFAAAGGRVRVLEGFQFTELVRPFDRYIRAMFRRKARSQGARRLFYKLMLNALYGKFGQRGERVAALPLERFRALDNPPPSFRVWGGLALFTERHPPPPWGNNVWPAIVTARARIRLWNELERLLKRGDRALYCDTDGILFQGRTRYPAKSETPGDFESRGRFPAALIRAKKEYGLQLPSRHWQFYAKGVPYDEREGYLRDGVATFRRPLKMREAARTGERPNVWAVKRKIRHVNFDHRGRRPDGSLAPVQVDETHLQVRRKV